MDSPLSETFLGFCRNSRLTPVLLAAVLNACASETVLLNSERIERQFGSYGIDILASEAGLRRSSLYSFDETERVCRTYAVVRFSDESNSSYSSEHAKVLKGNSLGEVFKSNGWAIRKQTLHIGSFDVDTEDSDILELMRIDAPQLLALHVYQLLLLREDDVFEYATILEAHHPHYLTEAELLEIYSYDKASSLTTEMLQQLTALVTARETS